MIFRFADPAALLFLLAVPVIMAGVAGEKEFPR